MAQRDPKRLHFWRTTLEEWKHSRQSVSAFCRSRSLTKSIFYRWQRILSEEFPPPVLPVPPSLAPIATPAFVPVRVVAEPMAEVVLPGGLVVRLPLAAESQAVTRLVAAVRAAAC